MSQPPPHDLAAEGAVLGACMLSEDARAQALDVLRPEDFYSPAHRSVFECVEALHKAEAAVDLVSVVATLRIRQRLSAVGGPAFVADLVDALPSTAAVGSAIRVVQDCAVRRRLLDFAAEARELATSDATTAEIVDQVETRAQSLVLEVDRKRAATAGEAMTELMSGLERTTGGELLGVTTGIRELDRITSGLQAAELILVAGRPGMGKSSLAMGFVLSAAKAGVPCLVFSLEMSRQQLSYRLVASEALVSVQDLRRGRLAPDEYQRVAWAAGALADLPFQIDEEAALSILEIRARTRRARREAGVGLIVVDYLQMARAPVRKQDGREREIAAVSAGLKALAKETQIPVVACCQLNRAVEGRADKRPQLSDLRESGTLEQDADTIMFVYRDEVAHPNKIEARGLAEIIVSKQRMGPIGTAEVAFVKEQTRFCDLRSSEGEGT